ncbi:MAG: segregation/condensation protein A [Candidatus Pacebacteria bacterium]|nr:segregation/condensation protein A [Candidatus Paceibacterota bacterium]MBP9715610.1 segregation/condensation protein A [Candidatus Paceibacterota bacterium]
MEETATFYKVKAGSFEGPLELLLSLIESRKLFVNEISLSDVTNDYISYVKSMSDIPTEKRVSDVSYFILIASTLILIKSKSLLPNLALSKDEEEKIVDLESRLSLYKIIKDVSVKVRENFGQQIFHAPMDRNFNEVIFSPDKNITIANMANLVNEVLQNTPKKAEPLPEVEIKKVMSIDEMINSLTDRIQDAMNLSFRDFTKSHGGGDHREVKVHVIVSFLAMLELVREGVIDVIQNNHFEDMSISKQIVP